MCWHIPNDMWDNDASSLILQLFNISVVLVSLRRWLGSSPDVSEFSSGTSVNYIGNSFLIRRNLFAPGGSMSPRMARAGHIYRLRALQELPFHQTESKLPNIFLITNPPSASSLLRQLYGGLLASSEFFVRTHFFWSYASEEEQRIRRVSNLFLSFTYGDGPFLSRLISH